MSHPGCLLPGGPVDCRGPVLGIESPNGGAMIVNVTELERGDLLEIDGDPWQANEVLSQTPSARGASLLVKAKIKNLRTGQTLAKTWRGGETVATAEVDYRPAQFLYRQGG